MAKAPPFLSRILRLTSTASIAVVVAAWPAQALSEDVVVVSPLGATVPSTGPVPSQPPAAQPQSPAPQPGKPQPPKPNNQQPGQPNKDKKEKNKDGKPEQNNGAPSGGGSEVKRPDQPPRAPDPRELDAKPDKNGRVPFNFHGQPWPDVLQWLANVSGYSLDWQELPSDYLNLTTQRTYSLPEARDLINRHLQARGYVMLLSGEVLSVFKLDKLDPSLVPTISEVALYDRQPHDMVKVAFELPASIDVSKAAEDFKQVLSKNAKLMPLAATKRVLAIDAVANLRLVSKLLNEERMAADGKVVPKRYVLKHARAEKVIETLYVVLGINPNAGPPQMTKQQQRQRAQMIQQMQRQGKKPPPMAGSQGPKVHMAFNKQENSILVNAEPRELRIIERTIEMLDIPAAGSVASGSPGVHGQRYPKTYKLENIEPESLMSTLREIGDLQPLTELKADGQADLLFVRASDIDHKKVAEIIQQLDTGGLKFEVFQLRYHPADGVAETVRALLGNKEDDKDNGRNSYYYDPWSYGYSSSSRNKKKTKQALQVEPDTENNRLLVRATEEDIQEVRALLRKIGELGGAPTTGPKTRVIDTLDANATRKVLEQLRKTWPSLEIQGEENLPPAKPEKPASTPTGKSARSVMPQLQLVSDTQSSASDEPARKTEPTDTSPPRASVTVTPDGRLMLSSDDPALLMKLEDLIGTLAPHEELFKVFEIQHADAYYLHWDLEDYFEDDLEGSDGGKILDWWGNMQSTGPKKTGLASRKKLRLIYNGQTNSIVVADATKEQLATVERLIEAWDKPPRQTDVRSRKTGIVKVKYSSATKIAAALKEVYRDLLSSRDKEFDNGEKGGSGYTLARTTKIEFAGVDKTDEKPRTLTDPIQVRFDGALSIGVDEVSGMLLISAKSELYDGVVDMIHLLDEEAKPSTTIVVHRIGAASAESIHQALSATAGTTWIGGKPKGPSAQPNNQQKNQRNRRGRDERRRRRRESQPQ